MKYIKSLVFMLIVSLTFKLEAVNALVNHPHKEEYYSNCIKDSSCTLLCAYTHETDADGPGNVKNLTSSYVYYDNIKKSIFVEYFGYEEYNLQKPMHSKLILDKSVYIGEDIYNDLLNNQICPTYYYLSASFGGHKLCFANNQQDCFNISKTNFEGKSILEYKISSSNDQNTNNKNNNVNNNDNPRLDYDHICENPDILKAMHLIGNIIIIAKYVVPFIIIILGMVDFGKAVISNDEKATTKASAALLRRFIAGVVIIFIPTIIAAVLSAIGVTDGIEDAENDQFGACTKCLFPDIYDCDITED